MEKKQYGLLSLPVIVSALGFFVDVFDLLLFGIVRKPSLQDIGLNTEDAIRSSGELLVNVQMIGMVVGGIAWGMLGDKKGRLKVLFGSIFLYAVATLANGFVHTIPQYVVVRFIAGFGLAGELGAGITLTSEILPKEKRGLAATIIAVTGVLGSVTAALLYKVLQDWRLLYYIGGGLGFVLLLMRITVAESGMYKQVEDSKVQRGNFLMFFNNWSRFSRYMKGILIGLPVWYAIGILVFFAEDFAKSMGLSGITNGDAVMYQYIGLAFGDLSAGVLSNIMKSRKKVIFIFYGILSLFIFLYFSQYGRSVAYSHFIFAGLGFGAGISVLYITTSAEQFGTNLRATASISITNMVRGFTPLMLLLFTGLRTLVKDYVTGGWMTGVIIMGIAVAAAYFTKESFGKDLDFVED